MVNKVVIAKCQYRHLGCEEPGAESPTWNCGEMAVKEPGMGSAQPCAKVRIMITMEVIGGFLLGKAQPFAKVMIFTIMIKMTAVNDSYFRAPKSFMPGPWMQKALNCPKG